MPNGRNGKLATRFLVAALLLFNVATVNEAVPVRPALRSETELRDDSQTIVSLRVAGADVLASTEAGLYRANLSKKKWQRLQAAGTPEPGGTFVSGGPDDRTLFYFLTPSGWRETVRRYRPSEEARTGVKRKQIARPGLYRSKDTGDSWERMDSLHDFTSMLRLPPGRMFAIAATTAPESLLVLLSEDEGRTWKDVTHGVSKHESLLFLLADPEHPQRVCLFGAFGMRRGGTIYGAEDDGFEWKARYVGLDAGRWPPDERKSEKDFFTRPYAPGYRLRWPPGAVESLPDELPGSTFGKENTGVGTVGNLVAQLDNYFAYPFHDQALIPEFDVIPEKTSYEFRLKQPMPVRAALTSHTKIASPKLLDSPDASLFWSIKMIRPDGAKITSPPRGDPLGHLADDSLTLEGSRVTRELKPFLLTAGKPHSRTIDLSILGRFDQPGRYKVQLMYHSGWWRDSQNVMRSLDTVAGPVFSVSIGP
jgi:hypothetical protein